MVELKKLQAVFQTLSDYSRLKILKSISDKEIKLIKQGIVSKNFFILYYFSFENRSKAGLTTKQ